MTLYCEQKEGKCLYVARFRLEGKLYCGFCIRTVRINGAELDKIEKIPKRESNPKPHLALEARKGDIDPKAGAHAYRRANALKRWGAKKVEEMTESTALIVSSVEHAMNAENAVKRGIELPIHFEIRILHKKLAQLTSEERLERIKAMDRFQTAVMNKGYAMRAQTRELDGFTRWEFWKHGTPNPRRW
jgi:hypothetical protein